MLNMALMISISTLLLISLAHNVGSVAMKDEIMEAETNLTNSHNAPILEMFARNSSLKTKVSQSCIDDFQVYSMYVNGIMHNSPVKAPTWVYQLLDATGKPGTGIMEGNLQWLGSFTECLKVEATKYNSTEVKFKGQYCTANLAINDLTPDYKSIMNQVQRTLSPVLNELQQLSFSFAIGLGLCIPSSCTAQELTLLLNEILTMFGITQVALTVDQDTCTFKEATKYSTGTIVSIVVLAIFALLLTIGTLYEITTARQRKDAENHVGKNTLEKVVLSFSIYKNGRKILDTPHNEGTLTCLHGIRFVSMAWVVLGHTYSASAFMPLKNFMDFMDIVRDHAFDIVMKGTFSVDTFFFLSGFLVAYLFLKEMKKTGGQFGPYKIFLFYFHRYWRLTPALAIGIVIQTELFKYLNDGPSWNASNEMIIKACEDGWWKNLLYIQNLGGRSSLNMCVNVSWYLACDMQFYVISLLIIYPLYRNKTIGSSILGAFFLASMLTPGLIIHYMDLPAMMSMIAYGSQKLIDFQTYVYIKPWCRMGPYIVGIILAVILHRTTLKPNLHWMVVPGGWLLAAILGLTLIFGTHGYLIGDSVMSNGLSVFYGACNRQAWAMVVAWVVFACVTGHGGFVNTLLSWKALIPLSRLTYSTYLIHLYVLMSFFDAQESTFYIGHYLVVILFLGMLAISLSLAFVYSLAFEAPMIQLEKIFLPKQTANSPIPNDRNQRSPNEVLTIQPSASDLLNANSMNRRKHYENEGFQDGNEIQ